MCIFCIPMPIGRGKGRGNERGEGDGVGRGSWRMAFGRRLSGIGTPALAHMAAALALAISSNWSLSEESKDKEEIGKIGTIRKENQDKEIKGLGLE